MKFYFCESCGKRITEIDIEKGQGKDKKLKGVYCEACAQGVLTMESMPLTNEEARKILGRPEASRRPSEKSITPAAGRAVRFGGAGHALDPGLEAKKRTGSRAESAWYIMAGTGVALVVILVFLFMANSAPSEKKVAQAQKLVEAKTQSPAPAPKQMQLPQPLSPQITIPLSTPSSLSTQPAVNAPVVSKSIEPEVAKSSSVDENPLVQAATLPPGAAPVTPATPPSQPEPAPRTDLPKAMPVAPPEAVEDWKPLLDALHQEILPLLSKGKQTEALAMLERGLGRLTREEALVELRRELRDVENLARLRQQAVAALRASAGKKVDLRMGKMNMHGLIMDSGKEDRVNLRADGGAEFSLGPADLNPDDVEIWAPKRLGAEAAEDLRCRGWMFLAANNMEKARAKFLEASRQTKAEELTALVRWLDILEVGVGEVRAREGWERVVALYEAQRWKEARKALVDFQQAFAGSKFGQGQKQTVEDRLKAIDKILFPMEPGIVVTYFKGVNFDEKEIVSRKIVKQIDFIWWEEVPTEGVPNMNISIRWTGFLKVNKEDTYVVGAGFKEGRFWLDGKQLVNAVGEGAGGRYENQVKLTEGLHEIRFESWKPRPMNFACQLLWRLVNGPAQSVVIPPENFMHDPKELLPK